jgi:hypothetical protein
MNEKDHMQRLADALGTRNPRRDGYGDYCLEGKRGTIHTDGKGYSVFASFRSAKGLGRCKAAFAPFAELRQDADAEAVFYLPALPDAKQAATVRYFLGLPKRRILSEAHRLALTTAGTAKLAEINHCRSVQNGLKRAQTGFMA